VGVVLGLKRLGSGRRFSQRIRGLVGSKRFPFSLSLSLPLLLCSSSKTLSPLSALQLSFLLFCRYIYTWSSFSTRRLWGLWAFGIYSRGWVYTLIPSISLFHSQDCIASDRHLLPYYLRRLTSSLVSINHFLLFMLVRSGGEVDISNHNIAQSHLN
jgi:hypothetical protein